MRRLLSYVWWPALFVLSTASVYDGLRWGHPVLVFNVTYLVLVSVLGLLERAMPHSRSWLRDDGQVAVDLLHTLFNKGVAQIMITVATFSGIANWLNIGGNGVWPGDWPLVLQMALGLLSVELSLYWKHRLSHEAPWLWRFHAVHHSMTRHGFSTLASSIWLTRSPASPSACHYFCCSARRRTF